MRLPGERRGAAGARWLRPRPLGLARPLPGPARQSGIAATTAASFSSQSSPGSPPLQPLPLLVLLLLLRRQRGAPAGAPDAAGADGTDGAGGPSRRPEQPATGQQATPRRLPQVRRDRRAGRGGGQAVPTASFAETTLCSAGHGTGGPSLDWPRESAGKGGGPRVCARLLSGGFRPQRPAHGG